MLATLAQNTYEAQPEIVLPPTWLTVVYFAVIIFFIASMWRIFTKAGEPGWYAIVPIWNTYTLCKVAGRPGWWWVLMVIPCVGTIIAFIVLFDLAKAFGKGGGFGLGLIFLSPIFIPILAFGSATHFTASRSRYGSGAGGLGSAGYGGNFGYPAGPPTPGGFTPGAGLPPVAHASPPSPALPSLPSIGSPTPFGSPGENIGLPAPFGSPGQNLGAPPPPPPPPVPAPPTPGAPAPGWYPDPAGGVGVRWWDGSAWTEHLSG